MRTYLILAAILSTLGAEQTVWTWDFDNLAEGTLPPGWKVEATGQSQSSAQWEVTVDQEAPLDPGVLSLVSTHHSERGVFNVCWTDEVQFREGQIAVFLKAHAGKIDQGGGPIWRVQDRDNYYISRYNPLEENVSIYYVKDGKRIMLAYSGKIDLKDGWHILKIRHQGNRIRAYIDGELVLMANGGDYIEDKGGVGVWTKADAATSFDNFTVVPSDE